MTENKLQKKFRLAMNDLLSTNPNKEHFFESKNFYKDYPCECGAENNRDGKTCWRFKAQKIKDDFHPFLHDKQ